MGRRPSSKRKRLKNTEENSSLLRSVLLVREKYPTRGPVKHALGRAAKNEFSKPRVAIRTHDKEIDFVFENIRAEHIANRAAIALHLFGDDFHSMAYQMLGELGQR